MDLFRKLAEITKPSHVTLPEITITNAKLKEILGETVLESMTLFYEELTEENKFYYKNDDERCNFAEECYVTFEVEGKGTKIDSDYDVFGNRFYEYNDIDIDINKLKMLDDYDVQIELTEEQDSMVQAKLLYIYRNILH